MITTEEIYFAKKKKSSVLFAVRFLWNVVCSGDFFSEIFVKQCLKYI